MPHRAEVMYARTWSLELQDYMNACYWARIRCCCHGCWCHTLSSSSHHNNPHPPGTSIGSCCATAAAVLQVPLLDATLQFSWLERTQRMLCPVEHNEIVHEPLLPLTIVLGSMPKRRFRTCLSDCPRDFGDVGAMHQVWPEAMQPFSTLWTNGGAS